MRKTEEHNSQNQSGNLFPAAEEISRTETDLIAMIKTTGKEKDYELIEYILNVNTQYTQVLMELNENGAMDAVYTYGVSRLTEDRFTGESNKEYGALARGAGYAAGNMAQAYLLSKGIENCGDLINKNRYGTGTYADGMPLEDAKVYLEFQDHGTKAGLTDAELLGIRKVDDAAALNMVNNNDLLALRKAENIKHDNFLKFGNVNGDINSKIGDFF